MSLIRPRKSVKDALEQAERTERRWDDIEDEFESSRQQLEKSTEDSEEAFERLERTVTTKRLPAEPDSQ